MFGHHAWATAQLLDFCAGLPPARLDLRAEGTYGAVLPTLIHLVAADQRFLLMLGAGEPQPVVREDMVADLDGLHAAWKDQVPRWQRLLPQADELEITDPIPPRAGSGPSCRGIAVHPGHSSRQRPPHAGVLNPEHRRYRASNHRRVELLDGDTPIAAWGVPGKRLSLAGIHGLLG